jgi:DNA gyrase subunit B
VNALSAKLHVIVERDGKSFEQEYHTGIPQYPARELGAVTERDNNPFLARLSIFIVSEYNKDILESRLRELAP